MPNEKTSRFLKCNTSLLVVLACLLCGPAPCFAHGVFIFAWAEGDRLCSESYFSKKSKVRGGQVDVLFADGELLASGRTDDAGLVCFAAPQKADDLLFVLNAGMGHRADFLLPAAQVAEALAAPAPPASSEPAPVPLHKAAAGESAAAGPSWRDILGGLGWIIGLAGLGAWYSSRRRKN
ncbi:hypothetical protein LJB82_00645 [Desulfovibrio sp. OttesenSCG-928-M16]|nr:hypothetical protein [Desulfovibrio sp. OttesenSCG-928-M16]